MSDQEYLQQLYFDHIYDFSNEKNCDVRLCEKDMDTTPIFSFMMCVYNDASLLNSAINSLLKQSFEQWELIVLDNSDKDDTAWKMLSNAMRTDSRIRAYRSEENVGWAKGASICLQYVRGQYTTFLAADDCINNGSLQRLYEIIQQESPDIIWVGNAEVEYQKDGDFKLKNTVIPSYTAYDVHNRSEVIRNLMEEVYYNSFFHYMRVDFLKKENINFFEPYYADCSGMTRAMVTANKMVSFDGIVYFLTKNTSQTAGYYIWDSYDFIFAEQWRSVKQIFEKENYQNQEDIMFVAMRIVNNLLGNVPSLCSGRCRNKYMNGIETDIAQRIQQLEDMLMCDEIAELLQISSTPWFKALLEKLGILKNLQWDMDSPIIRSSWIYPLLYIVYYKEELSETEYVEILMDWLLAEQNERCVGFDYFVEKLNELDDKVLIQYMSQINQIAAKYDALNM